MNLGEKVKRLVGEYKEGKYNSPSTLEFDKKEKLEK